MNYTIAIAGKGGTGKTTIAGLIIRCLCENKLGSVLAIDADPNSNLGQVLGIPPKENIGAIIDEISKNLDKIPAGMTKERYIEYRVQSAIEESTGIDVLSMGRPEGPGCYCYANNVLRGLTEKIAGDYNFVVIDNEAGLEHLSRRTTRRADCLFIVSDPTPVGLRSARRIYELSLELNINIKKYILVINRVTNNEKVNFKDELLNIKFDDTVFIPFDAELLETSIKGSPILALSNNSIALKAVRDIIKKTIMINPKSEILNPK